MHPRRAAEVIWLIALLFVATGLLTPVARGETLHVVGAVSGSWESPIDTVVIDGFSWIPEAETLRISPGMVVAFSGRFSLVVSGTLLAEGAGTDSIRVQSRPYHANNGHGGFRFYESTTVSKLNKVLFEDGLASFGNFERYGGAIELFFAEVEIDSCFFRGNRALIDGGAIYCREAGTLTVRDSDFEGDSTRLGGGGAILSRTSGRLRLERCRFINNRAATDGGAVVSESGVLAEVIECFFAENVAAGRAGGLQFRSSPPGSFAQDCVVEFCTADQGGGVYLNNSRAIMEGCSVRSCSARWGGGVAARGSNNITVLTTTVIENNTAMEDGGGLYFTENARCEVSNSMILGNTALRGGAVYGSSGTSPTVRFTTMVGNVAEEGSAIHLHGGGILTNSIVTGEGESSLLHFGVTTTARVSFSNFYSSDGPEFSGLVPPWLLQPTQLNVALVECDSLRNISFDPQFVDPEQSDFRLAATSPCLFGADTSQASGTDFLGHARVAPVGSWPDMGAFESAATLPYSGPCGSQSGVWYPGDYILGCTLRVAQHDTLVILDGVRLLFGPGAAFVVDGTLLAMGTARTGIRFQRYFQLSGAYWNGIILTENSVGSRLQYCEIRDVHRSSAVTISQNGALFDHCSFTACSDSSGSGGGVESIGGSPEFRSCLFTGLVAENGGAVFVSGGSPRFNDCEFRLNFAKDGHGGGMFIAEQAEVELQKSKFSKNEALMGGGMSVTASLLTVTECRFDSCEAKRGGAVFESTSEATLSHNEFVGNSGREFGGAVYLDSGVCFDSGSRYSANTSFRGGAVNLKTGYFASDSTEFVDNNSELEGGAIRVEQEGTVLIQRSTLYRNRSAQGGALYGYGGSVEFESCLFDSNFAAQSGGGVFLQGGGMILRRSTCVNQQSPGGSVVHVRGTALLQGNSTLFAMNGNSPVYFGSNTAQEFEFCMSDVLITSLTDTIGAPLRTNFNGDSCDARLNLVADAGFVNSADRNYALQSFSKAVHAADSLLPPDMDDTRADIGLYSGVRPYSLPNAFNLVSPARNASFHPGDTITFAWNEAHDDDPGDVVSYFFRLTGDEMDSTIAMQGERVLQLSLLHGEYVWWCEAVSTRPSSARESFERRRINVADPALSARRSVLPQDFSVSLAGPNPFNSSTRLRITLPRSAEIDLRVFDVLGRQVEQDTRLFSAGVHRVDFDGSGWSSGVYWVIVNTGDDVGRMKLLLLK